MTTASGSRFGSIRSSGSATQHKAPLRYPDPNVCPNCEVVFAGGRWCWILPSVGASRELCPACRRIEDHYPAGIVTLSGSFLRSHRTEILDLLHNEEIAERDEHPLNRLMGLEEGGGTIVATMTGTQLAQRIAEVLRSTYGGELEIRYSDDDSQVQVRWSL